MKKELIVAIIASLIIGLFIGTSSSLINNSDNQIYEEIKQKDVLINELENSNRCLVEISLDGYRGISNCLSSCFSVDEKDSENEMNACRKCLFNMQKNILSDEERNECAKIIN